ncbi:hypothetical protein [Gordonia sp. MP11Mi]|uniref:Uncharacterized protein n=1 Tax=Gordonia sp. MP11Mi TaxID=3022769 RepID=A0AA97CWS2_9ACTN
MAGYSPYQRMMLSDSAKSLAAHRRTAQHSSAIEQHLSYSRLESHLANSAILDMNSEILEKQNEIAAATRANNALLAQQLGVQVEQLKLQKQEAERRAEEEAKRDRQAFAIWRQTPDGQSFTAWYGRAVAVAEEIEANDKHWRGAVEAIKSEWKSTRREQVEFAVFNPDERNAAIAKRLFTGAGVCVSLWIIFLLAGVIGLVNLIFILGALGFAGAGVWRFFSSDKPQRTATLVSLRAQGTDELGFDPMSEEVPPWSTTDCVAYARQIRLYCQDAYRTHPSASSLPEISQYRFVDPASIKSPALKQLLPH